MRQHTPGPWRVRRQGYAIPQIEQDKPLGQAIGEAYGGKQSDANASLIAAAPELLAACEQTERAFNVAEIDPLVAFAVIENVREAIRKATTN